VNFTGSSISLPSLTTIGSFLYFTGSSISLPSLTTIGSYLRIYYSSNINLQNLQTVNDFVYLYSDSSFSTFSSLNINKNLIIKGNALCQTGYSGCSSTQSFVAYAGSNIGNYPRCLLDYYSANWVREKGTVSITGGDTACTCPLVNGNKTTCN
jgi:hypothetical protein